MVIHGKTFVVLSMLVYSYCHSTRPYGATLNCLQEKIHSWVNNHENRMESFPPWKIFHVQYNVTILWLQFCKSLKPKALLSSFFIMFTITIYHIRISLLRYLIHSSYYVIPVGYVILMLMQLITRSSLCPKSTIPLDLEEWLVAWIMCN